MNPAIQNVTILGATGSVGVNTLRVIAADPGRFRVYALSANGNIDLLFKQCLEFQPEHAVIATEENAIQLRRQLLAAGVNTSVHYGKDALCSIASAPEVDCVMAAIVGGAGLMPTFAAASSGKKVLLANKEALVMAGSLFMEAAAASKARIIPIDSEHNAIFQCLPINSSAVYQKTEHDGFAKIVLTASGGPCREMSLAELDNVTPAQACAHPNWEMGKKISVDSATMVNKALEVIEASFLFATPSDKIEIMLHPQSIVHSMVYYRDGSVLAQLGNPDMRTPIAYGLAWPARMGSEVQMLDLASIGRLDFMPPDTERFPGLRLGQEAAKVQGTAPIIFNAANEVAVAAFLAGQVGFTQIPAIIDAVLQSLACPIPDCVDAVLETDNEARALAAQYLPEFKAAIQKRALGH